MYTVHRIMLLNLDKVQGISPVIGECRSKMYITHCNIMNNSVA